MLGFDLLKMEAQGLEQDVREHGEAVILPFAIADDDLAVGEVQILNAQAKDFHQAESAAVHDLSHYFVDPVHLCDHFFGFLPGKDRRNPFRFCGADGDQGFLIQLDIEHIAVEEKDGADGLVLRGGRHRFLVDKMGDEFVDLCHAHLARMALVMEKDILPDPADVGLFGAEGVMTIAKELAVLVEQLFALRRTLRTSGFPRRWDIWR